jgi:hypothetical protein
MDILGFRPGGDGGGFVRVHRDSMGRHNMSQEFYFPCEELALGQLSG